MQGGRDSPSISARKSILPQSARQPRHCLEARGFDRARKALLAGEHVNLTEDRAAWHTMLRAPDPIEAVAREHQRVRDFVQDADAQDKMEKPSSISGSAAVIGACDWRRTPAAAPVRAGC